MNNLISIYQTFDSLKASLIKSKLDSENIYCFLKTNDASGVLPHLSFSQGGTEVCIKEKDLEIVKIILNNLEDND